VRSQPTVTATLGGALLFMAQVTLTPARAMEGILADSNVPGPVPITYYLPKNYDAKRAQPYPLLIQLHGGCNRFEQGDGGGSMRLRLPRRPGRAAR